MGLPLIKPPYGRITAFDMNKGDIVWQIAHGETPDNIKNHPALRGVTIPKTGRTGRIGMLVTKSLLVAGEGGFFTTPNGQRGAMLRAYDKATGNEVGVGLHARAAERLADDLHAQRQAVHRARDQRRLVHGRAGGVQAPSSCRGLNAKGRPKGYGMKRVGFRGGPSTCFDLLIALLIRGVRAGWRAKRRVADLRRRPRQHAVLAARSDQRGQLQQARGRLALQDRRARPAARVQLRVDAADGRRRRLRHRRHAPRRGRARCGDRRDAVDAQRERRQARRRGAAPAVGPRPRLLDRRPRTKPDHLRHARLSDARARREDRRARCRRSARTASSI